MPLFEFISKLWGSNATCYGIMQPGYKFNFIIIRCANLPLTIFRPFQIQIQISKNTTWL